jgi:O-antigen ligase
MMLATWQQKFGLWQSWLLVAFVFSLPISSAAPNIILLLMLVFSLLEGEFARKWQQLKAHPLFVPMLAFALLYPVSLLWTEDMAWGVHLVERHAIYLLFPLLLTAMRREHIGYYLSAFILAMTLSETASYLVWFHLVAIPGIDPLDPAGFLGHWEYNPFLALAIYWMTHTLLFSQPKPWQKWVFSLFIVTMTINMFITGGRIGQIAYFVMLLLLFAQFFANKPYFWKGVTASVLGLITVFSLAYQTSDLFHQRVDLGVYEVTHYDPNTPSSVGNRFSFWINTLTMIQQRPLLGSGIGDFPQDYNTLVGESAPVHMSTFGKGEGHSQPHDQYLFELANFGLFGFAVFVWLFVTLIREALMRQDEWQRLRQAFVTLTLVIMLTDSYLLVQAFAYLFVVMIALLWTPNPTRAAP